MSDHIIYGVIGFVLGAILGGLSMGIVCGKEYKKTIDRLQDENDKLKNTKREEKAKDISERTKSVEKKEKELISKEGYSKDEDEDFDSDEDVDFEDPFGDGDDEEKDIRIITKKQYDEDLLVRDTETLTFYQKDGILADRFDEPITNQTDIIGIDAIEKAEETEDDAIYVSNDFEDKIYEVIVEHNETFYRDVER